jgi:hypothetical protein
MHRLSRNKEQQGEGVLPCSLSLLFLVRQLPDLPPETYPLRIMLRGMALLGFILTGIGTLLPWFRWEMVISGREAIFEVSALDMADRGETILVFAVVGGTVVWFA